MRQALPMPNMRHQSGPTPEDRALGGIVDGGNVKIQYIFSGKYENRSKATVNVYPNGTVIEFYVRLDIIAVSNSTFALEKMQDRHPTYPARKNAIANSDEDFRDRGCGYRHEIAAVPRGSGNCRAALLRRCFDGFRV